MSTRRGFPDSISFANVMKKPKALNDTDAWSETEPNAIRMNESSIQFWRCKSYTVRDKQPLFLDSSMVEHTAVNRGVAGSSPARGV